MSVRSVLAVAMALAAAPLTMSPQGLLPNDSAAANGAMSDFGNGRGMQQIAAAGPALAGPTHAAGNAIELQAQGRRSIPARHRLPASVGTLKAPEATLLDGAGAEFGRHFGGPSWQARDGSTVVGEVMVSNPAPKPGSIPWLLLRAPNRTGHAGTLTRRSATSPAIRTKGGVAPADGCDATHARAERRVAYSAGLYVFFSQPRAARLP